MAAFQVVITDYEYPHVETEKQIIEAAGGILRAEQCKTAEQLIAAAADADALMVQSARITAEVLAKLPRCKLIVRYGIGVDAVDIAAAKERGIAVCNVPGYGIDEVADHALALALATNRLLLATDRAVRDGWWNSLPPGKILALRGARFVTAGFGRIGRAVLDRARAFGCEPCSYDPFVPDAAFREAGVSRLGLAEAFASADILSLHLPLNSQTNHLADRDRLATMKSSAIVVNTARGGLIDTIALAGALSAGAIRGAGLDVFETEPLPMDHPLRNCPGVILTSHTAWYSDASVPRLQRMAAEEVARAIRGQPLLNQVNR